MGSRMILAIAVTALAAMPAVAWADPPVGFERSAGSGAFAFWSPAGDDDVVTEVAAFAHEEGARSHALLGVFQGWCDEASDELVSRSFFGGEDASTAVAPLRSATMSGDVVLEGFEIRFPGCDDPSFDSDWEETELGLFPVTVEAAWSGRGAPLPYGGPALDPHPRCGFAGAGAGADREADARVSITGVLPLAGGVDLTELIAEDGSAGLYLGAWAGAFTSFGCSE